MITFPQPLEVLLNGSDLQPEIRKYANLVGKILVDNKLPFFPDYTDHGIDHINQVLAAEIDLVPPEVWEKSTKDARPRLLCDVDAVVIIGATLLHDLAMHLREDGFLELVGENSRFKPLPWFKDAQKTPKADRPWHELWLDYQSEAKRFSDKALGNIIGLESVRQGWKFDKLPEDKGLWDRNHHLIIGEFIRRHHARLAHEIAIYGFPGLEAGECEGQIPALGSSGHHLQRLADLIGLAARSHGLSLRFCQDYLDFQYPRQPKPMGCAVLYPMALLRVADYLQIDRQRTPPALLKLRNPQSPVSVQEWTKHLAVQYIGPARDPRGKMITVSPDISQTIYLQLRELLAGLQQEMDHSTAVLDEAYGLRGDLGLDQLKLTTRRVHSNLDDPNFRDSLPYVPERTGFTADPNLLTLLVEPLYGKEPGVGVRELMQNSVDAVRELRAWCEAHGKRVEDLDLPDQEADVQIDFIDEQGDGNWLLRVTDKGIGMTADTIQNYFLRAGASFRQSPEWTKEFVDDDGKPRVLRAGRFGIGAFAIFLLGPRFRLWTRHVGSASNEGYCIKAEGDSQIVKIWRDRMLKVGTVIEVEISEASVRSLKLNGKDTYDDDDYNEQDYVTDWFCWDWPLIGRRVILGASTEVFIQKHIAALRKIPLPLEWYVIHPKGFDAVYWTFENYPSLVCNGIKISNLLDENEDKFDWLEDKQFSRPVIAVLDRCANLPLTIQRYDLTDDLLPFTNELSRDVILSFIAHALICGPTSRAEAHILAKQSKLHPLVKYEKVGKEALFDSPLIWCSSSRAVIPYEPWLYMQLIEKGCFIIGEATFGHVQYPRWIDTDGKENIKLQKEFENHAIISCNSVYEDIITGLKILGKNFVDIRKDGYKMFNNDVIAIILEICFENNDDLIDIVKSSFQDIDLSTGNIFRYPKGPSRRQERLYGSVRYNADFNNSINLMEFYKWMCRSL